MTVLVVTQQLDVTADLVIKELYDLGAEVFRCDAGQFPIELELSASTDGTGAWRGRMRLGERTVDLDEISSVYYRKPSPFVLADEMSLMEDQWARREARYGLGGVLAGLNCDWMSHPHAIAEASYKPMWMAAATTARLNQPASLITNNPDEAAKFTAAQPTIYKSMSGGPGRPGTALFTTPVAAAADLSGVAGTAHLFQQRIIKDYEVRLTIVDDQCFAARIDAHTSAAAIDWRSDYDGVTYEAIETPPVIANQLRELLTLLDLRFAAVDFIVTPDGQWFLVDVNPNGQWGWIADAAGLPIAHAIATALTTKDTP